jgi:hypothetical protein
MVRKTEPLNPERTTSEPTAPKPIDTLRVSAKNIRRGLAALASLATAIYAITAMRQCAVMRSANEENNSALHVQQRAYLTTGPVVLLISDKIAQIPINNHGRISSGEMQAVIHEQTIDLDVEHGRAITRAYGWKRIMFGPVRPGTAVVVLAVPVKGEVPKQILTAREVILIAGVITYNDGFADDPSASWPFCIQSHAPRAIQIPWTECDPKLMLPWMEKMDGFPKNEDAF